MMISRYLRRTDGNRLTYWCQGCCDYHSIDLGRWAWDGNTETPTFSPSVLVRSGHYAEHSQVGTSCWCTYNEEQRRAREPEAPFRCGICHTFIQNGMVQFLPDCTHELAGQTLRLAELPEEVE